MPPPPHPSPHPTLVMAGIHSVTPGGPFVHPKNDDTVTMLSTKIPLWNSINIDYYMVVLISARVDRIGPSPQRGHGPIRSEG